MLSWMLWRALNDPPRRHPLFRYTLSRARRANPRATTALFMWLVTFTGTGLCWTVTFDWIPSLILVLVLAVNTLFGAFWAVNISAAIVGEQLHSRYDLLAALPIGRLGTSWAMCTGYMHRRPIFTWVPFFARLLAIVTLFTLTGALFITLFVTSNQTISESTLQNNVALVPLIIFGIGCAVIFYMDHQASFVMAVLFGLLTPIDMRNETEARLQALSGFLLFQMVVYLLVGAAVYWLIPQFAAMQTHVYGFWLSTGITLIFVTLYILIRESLIIWLWRILVHRLNADLPEIRFILKERVWN